MEQRPSTRTVEDELSGEHGEVFTRRWVVELILDLAGYTADRDLANVVALEPACGAGAFLVPMVERLVASAHEHRRPLANADRALVAIDLRARNVERSQAAVRSTLAAAGVDGATAHAQSMAWVRRSDFLLDPPAAGSIDVVVGNPPYIRLEAVPRERREAYRRACATMTGRADVYVGYEHGLLALRHGGVLSFICADRWMRNQYGARLRAMVSDGWSVDAVLSLTGADAFNDPAITVFRQRPQHGGPLVVEAAAGFVEAEARVVADLARQDEVRPTSGDGYRAARLDGWYAGRAGWPSCIAVHASPHRHLRASA